MNRRSGLAGLCNGKGIRADRWVPGDIVRVGQKVKSVTPPRWDARHMAHMLTVTWSNGSTSYLSGSHRLHLERCPHRN